MKLWAAAFAASCLAGGPAIAHDWRYAAFADPTERYAHAVLGDGIEYGALELRSLASVDPLLHRVTLTEDRVFEDIAPRKTRLGADNHEAVVVVESQRESGAQLVVYDIIETRDPAELVRRAATPAIGQRYRWLAPAGIADFDGDGHNDIAYVETPHLGKILKIVTLSGDQLVPIVSPKSGFSNHRIGEDFITSGVRQCGGLVEILTPNADWSALMAARIESGQIVSRETPFEPSLAGDRASETLLIVRGARLNSVAAIL